MKTVVYPSINYRKNKLELYLGNVFKIEHFRMVTPHSLMRCPFIVSDLLDDSYCTVLELEK